MEFYQNNLKTWQHLRRPPSVLGHAGKESCPVIFGYVQGHEQSLLVSTEEGNENSKANLEEVAEVVGVRETLPAGAPGSARASWRREHGRLLPRCGGAGPAPPVAVWSLRSASPSS